MPCQTAFAVFAGRRHVFILTPGLGACSAHVPPHHLHPDTSRSLFGSFPVVLACQGCRTKIPHTGELKQKCIFSWFWKLWDQDQARNLSSRCRQGLFRARPLFLASRHLVAGFPLCTCGQRGLSGVSFPSDNNTSPIRSELYLRAIFNLGPPWRPCIQIQLRWGLMASAHEFKGLWVSP